jgi:hypothetical protein
MTIWSRPATVEQRYSDVARVRFEDTGSLAYVPREEVDG